MAIIDLVYPKHCPVCLRALPPGKTLICPPCEKKIRRVRDPFCLKCGRPMDSKQREFCRQCERNMPAFIQNIAWAEYSSFYIRRMLYEVKYEGNRQLLDYPCLDFSKTLRPYLLRWKPEVLIPVPVHQNRLRERGYNQALEIAERLSESLHIPVDSDSLIRSSETAAQKNLGKSGRALNLLSAFSWKSPKKYHSVLLLDDIYTTGATLNACTGVCRRAGIEKVYAACLSIGRV